MTLEIFEFVEQLMMDTFKFKLTKFENLGSIIKIFISLGIVIINVSFRT